MDITYKEYKTQKGWEKKLGWFVTLFHKEWHSDESDFSFYLIFLTQYWGAKNLEMPIGSDKNALR